MSACLRHGLIIELGGRHSSVLRFLPPLIVTGQQIDQVLDIFAVALKTAVLGMQNEKQIRNLADETTLLVD